MAVMAAGLQFHVCMGCLLPQALLHYRPTALAMAEQKVG